MEYNQGRIVYMFDWRQVYADIYRVINERIAAKDYKTAKMLIISNISTFLGFLEVSPERAKEILNELYLIPETDIYRLQYLYSFYARKLELGPIAPKSERDSYFDRIVKKVIEKHPELTLEGLMFNGGEKECEEEEIKNINHIDQESRNTK